MMANDTRLPVRATPGRAAALLVGTLACLLGVAAAATWMGTRQRACPAGSVQFFDFVKIGEAVSVVVAAAAALVVAAAVRRAPHRVGVVLATLLTAVSVLLPVGAAAVRHGGVHSCFTF